MFEDESRMYQKMAAAIDDLCARSTAQPSLSSLAQAASMSDFHFQRTFQDWVGITPKQFLQVLSRMQSKDLLDDLSIAETALELGYSSESRLYDNFIRFEAITPGDYKKLGKSIVLSYGVAPSPFGPCLIAWTERGITKLAFENEKQTMTQLVKELACEWPLSSLVEDSLGALKYSELIFCRPQNDTAHQPLRLWVKGSVFQVKVWEALLRVPSGATLSYRSLAEFSVGKAAVRAAASAIAKNPVGFLIPCHRVLRNNGAINQYRWGASRKASMILRELGERATTTL